MSNEQDTQRSPQGDINQPLTPQEMDSARALIPAYAIGAVDEEERAFVQRALTAVDSLLAEELAEYDVLAEALLYSSEQVAPPPGLRQKLMNAAVPGSAQPASISFVGRLKTWFVLPETGALRYAPLAAVLALVLLIGSNLFWLTRVNSLTTERDSLQVRVVELDSLVRTLGTDRIDQTELASTGDTSETIPSASLVWARVGEQNLWIARLHTVNLPSLESGMVYQFWMVHEGTPLSFGTFTVDEQGEAVLIFDTDVPIRDYDSVGVTAEPEGGSPRPTSSAVVRTDL